MKESKLFLTILAAVLIVTLSIGSALAYFTDSTDVNGKETVYAGAKTQITEDFDGDGHKRVSIKNTSDKVTVFIRVKAYSTHGFSLVGDNWETRGEYIYYKLPLAPGETAAVLHVDHENFPTGYKEGESFTIVVVHECVPARFDEDGNPLMEESWSNDWVTIATPKPN